MVYSYWNTVADIISDFLFIKQKKISNSRMRFYDNKDEK
jgi:hypothetical protein